MQHGAIKMLLLPSSDRFLYAWQVVSLFLQDAFNQAAAYRGSDIMMTFGSDFAYGECCAPLTLVANQGST